MAGTITETAKTEGRGGWKRVKLAAGAVHWSALLRRRCLWTSGDWDFTAATFWTSGANAV